MSRETQLVCPNCRVENLAGALTCYRCNAKMPSAPGWVGPASFKVYDASKDRGTAYLYTIVGGLGVVVCYFLAWLGVPKDASDAGSRGSSAFDILFGAQGSRSAIGSGGVGESSIGLDVRLALLIAALAALGAILIAIIRPQFGALLMCGLVVLAGAVYFFLQLVFRNNAQFNTPDLVGLLRIGFYGTLVGGLIILVSSFRYRKVETFPSRI